VQEPPSASNPSAEIPAVSAANVLLIYGAPVAHVPCEVLAFSEIQCGASEDEERQRKERVIHIPFRSSCSLDAILM
jgi:hypothetical protein